YNSQSSLFSLFHPVQELFSHPTATFFQTHGLTGAFPQIVQLRPANFTTADNSNLFDLRRMERELALHTFVGHNPPHREHLTATRAAPRDHHTRKNLNALFVAFQDLGVHID